MLRSFHSTPSFAAGFVSFVFMKYGYFSFLLIFENISEARSIASLPQYLDQRLVRLIIDIERIDYIRTSIKAVRNDLPDGAVEAEKKSESHGRQPVLVS